jgi:hypothetical protein
MNKSCEACARGPSTVDGHGGLTVHSMGVAGMLFKCRQCELTWMRSYSSDGRYGWTRLADHTAATACVGIVMPSAVPSPAAVAEISGEQADAMDHWLAIRPSWKQTPRRPS